jgi:dihydroorotate dehydrogenase (NAD+) catalytic subunit
MIRDVDLTAHIGRIVLQNPVLAASGTFGFGPEYRAHVDMRRLGGIAVKGVAVDSWSGNPPPRVWETPSGLLNSIGLQNPGVRAFIRDDLPFLRELGTVLVVNVIGHTVDEYRRVSECLARESGIAALEVNISCPNIKEGGMQFGHDPDRAFEVVRAVVETAGRPVWVKLSPNTDRVLEVGQAAQSAGAAALTAINTLLGMAIDLDRRRPALGGGSGGLSGPAIRPVGVRVVYEVSRRIPLPVVGMGGIETARDALEYFMAGASAVMVGTATFGRPDAMTRVIDDLPEILRQYGFGSVAEAVGAAHPPAKGEADEH